MNAWDLQKFVSDRFLQLRDENPAGSPDAMCVKIRKELRLNLGDHFIKSIIFGNTFTLDYDLIVITLKHRVDNEFGDTVTVRIPKIVYWGTKEAGIQL
jgi:hypothetical protein